MEIGYEKGRMGNGKNIVGWGSRILQYRLTKWEIGLLLHVAQSKQFYTTFPGSQ